MKPSDPLEKALQASLRPVDPGAAFTTALQARLTSAALSAATVRGVTQPSMRARVIPVIGGGRFYSASLGLAASLVVALGIGWQLREVRAAQRDAQVRREQVRIHNQLLLALEIASEGVNLAQQRIEQYQSQEKSL